MPSEDNSDSESLEKESGGEPTYPTYPCYCTYACTGTKTSYQAIFVCRTCSQSSSDLLCVCEACANYCHEAALHDEVEYLGMGYAYCDCNQLEKREGCKLMEASTLNVSEWKIPVGLAGCNLPLQSCGNDPQRYVMDAYTIPELYQNEAACHDLVEEACMMV